jgi:hypothetical protein
MRRVAHAQDGDKMHLRCTFFLSALILSGCASQLSGDRISINSPVLTSDLQAARSYGDVAELKRRYASKVSITIAKALELYVPADYAVFPEPGIDLSRNVVLDRSRTWSDALPAALSAQGIEMNVESGEKKIRLKTISTSPDSKN